MAQPALTQPEYYLGVRGGVTASTVLFRPKVSNMDPFYNGCMIAPQAGLAFRYLGHKCCGLQLEANYLQYGWAERTDDRTYLRRLHYVQVPFLMHLYFGKNGWHGTFDLGPEIAYCVHDEGGNGQETMYTAAAQYRRIERPFDWGVAGGLGVSYTHPRAGVIELSFRAQYSLGTIYGNAQSDNFSGMSNPLMLSVNLAYLFRVK